MLTRKLLRDLWRWRAQVVAIAAIVACGIASYISLASITQSLEASLSAYYSQYRFAQVFDQLTRAPDLMRRAIAGIPGVTDIQTRVVRDVTLDVPGRSEPATGRLVSIPDNGPPALNGLHLREGRYIAPGSRGEVISSEAFAAGNDLHTGSALGAVINGRWKQLYVVGIAISPEYVYELRYGELYPDASHFGVLWMGNAELSAALDMEHSFNDVSLTFAPDMNEADIIAALDRVLERYGGVGAYGRHDQLSARFLSEEFTQLSTMAFIIPTIFLSVAAFLLNVLLMRLVSTQRDQIAILKAFGFSNASIALHFLGFVAMIVLLGAIAGSVVGVWWGHAFADLYRRFFHLPLLTYHAGAGIFIGALGISAGASVAGALIAVRKAFSLMPAEAMRPEVPATYHSALLERLGEWAQLSLVARIVMRNLERRPMMTLLSALGVALAMALLMFGWFTREGVEAVADRQFRHVQREDATIVFDHALSRAAAYDLASYPGVSRVEPFRSVGARVSHDHRWRRIALIGSVKDPDLRPIFSSGLRRIAVPPKGILISKSLLDALGIAVGEPLAIHVLEGRRPNLHVTVVGTVDDAIGSSAYLDLETLGRLLDEQGRASGAYVAFDPLHAEQLYHRLKRTPNVAAVTFREASMQSFYKTIAQNLTLDIIFVLSFACIIAFGVAYNAARISLSERARELSTLRILGFTRGESWNILAGEQFALALLAILPGLAFGALFSSAMSHSMQTEYYRIPVPITPSSVAFAIIFIFIVTAVSALIVRRQVDRLDLIAVLKAGD
jgi:putative ABC transport system permease protein